MRKPKHLPIGGLVAMGFDSEGKFLLVVSHSERGLISVGTWETVAHDAALAYPNLGKAIGIGPIDGQEIDVVERDERRDRIEIDSPDGEWHLLGESDGVTIT